MNIKLHLDAAESDPVARLAEVLQVKPEDVLYTALNRLMLHAREPEIQQEIVLTRQSRIDNLPLWADSAGSAHNYEGLPPCEPEKSKYSV
ncbi:MAG TPA: hypothetical protein VHD61_08735 [Lacunisphaera sp.]|nr:hypothetical protein [Lacunisphaera sp.]